MTIPAKFLALALILWTAYLPGQAQLTNGAIISWNNDTLPVKIAYTDIVNLQRELHVESAYGREIFRPGEIRGFILNKNENLRLIDFSIYPVGTYSNLILDEHNNAIPNSSAYVSQRGLPSGAATEPGRANELKLFDSLSLQRGTMAFTSITIDNNFSFFATNASKPGAAVQAYYYYYKVIPTQKLLSPQTALDLAAGRNIPRSSKIIYCNIVTFKDGKYLPYPIGASVPKYRKWLSGIVSDYPQLSKPVRNKEFPLSYFMVVNAYNSWRFQPSTNTTQAGDTSVTTNILIGVSDAKKYYNPKKFFWPTFAGSSLILFPGMVYGASKITTLEKHANQIEVPNINPAYANDKYYKQGYRSTVIAKSGKAVERGILLGACVSVAAALTLALTE